MAKKKSKEHIQKEHQADVAKALEVLFTSEYIDKKKLYLNNFVRGMFFSAGGIIGATAVIALLLWLLSLFDTLPLVGPLFENTQETIKKR